MIFTLESARGLGDDIIVRVLADESTRQIWLEQNPDEGGRNAIERAKIGRRIDDALMRVGELHTMITQSEPETLQGAAVQRRRAMAMLEDEKNQRAQALVASALGVVEASAIGG